MTTEQAPQPSLLSTEQVAQWLNVSPNWVNRRWRDLGGVKLSHRIIRYSPESIVRWIEDHSDSGPLPVEQQPGS